MKYQLVRKPASWAKRGPNARTDLGDEAKARALARNHTRCQITPLVARKDGAIIDGNRTHWGLELQGMLDVELDFIITDEELTPDQIRVMQANSAFHREDLPDFDKATVMRDILASRPGMTKKQLAEEVLDSDPSLPTRYLSLFECIPEVQEVAKTGKLRVGDWYAIAKLAPEDQPGLLALKLSGASCGTLERQGRKKRSADKPVVRTSRIRCPLVSGPVVTVAGDEISLDDAIEALKEAAKAMQRARDTGLDASTAQRVWSDMAKAGV
jgi:hypothetical protein